MAFVPIFWDGFIKDSKRWDLTNYLHDTELVKYDDGFFDVGRLKKVFTTQQEVYSSFLYKNTSLADSGSCEVFTLYEDTSNIIYITATRSGAEIDLKYSIDNGVTYAAVDSYDFYSEDWHHIEVRVKIGLSGIVQIKVDDTLVVDATPDLSLFAGIDNMFIDELSGDGAYDNFVIGTGDWPGDMRVAELWPRADGDVQEWTSTLGFDHHVLANEVWDTSIGLLIANEADKLELFKTRSMGTAAANIFGVGQACSMGKTGAYVPKNAKHAVRISSVDYAGDAFAVPYGTPMDRLMINSPATGVPWTQSELDGLQFGILSVE